MHLLKILNQLIDSYLAAGANGLSQKVAHIRTRRKLRIIHDPLVEEVVEDQKY